MKTRSEVSFADTNIIPDRNAGIGSLLWDLQDRQYGPPLLAPEFAFIDVGVSRARTAAALKTLLAGDLKMGVEYVATELPEAVPYAHVTLLSDRAEKIREHLSLMSPSGVRYQITDWHFVVDSKGNVASVTYSYRLHGNEVWEAYFMGRPFMYSGGQIEFSDPILEKMLAPDVATIEAGIELERILDRDTDRPAPSWEGYRVERDTLEAGLTEFGIALQKTDVPQRIEGRQNVMFLANVLNHYPRHEQVGELERITANMKEGDIVIVQVDDADEAFIDVLRVKEDGNRSRERLRWIDTKTLEVRQLVPGTGSHRLIRLRPEVERIANRLMECIGTRVNSPEWSPVVFRALVHKYIGHVFGTFFRALPVEKTIRIAVRDALSRLPSEGGPKGMPVFTGDVKDAFRGGLMSDATPIVSDQDLVYMTISATDGQRTLAGNGAINEKEAKDPIVASRHDIATCDG